MGAYLVVIFDNLLNVLLIQFTHFLLSEKHNLRNKNLLSAIFPIFLSLYDTWREMNILLKFQVPYSNKCD